MADVLTKEQRSYCMSRIGGKDTRPEHALRKLLFARGFRYRLHAARLPGKPDLVLPKYRAVIFVHGCFWHGHDCPLFRWPATNRAFWELKLSGNRKHDAECTAALLGEGWRVLTVWECAFKGPRRRGAETVARVAEDWLRSSDRTGHIQGSDP